MKPPLKLTVRVIRALQERHGISNLLKPTPEDGEKMATADFLIDLNYEGSRSWENPPTKDELEDVDIVELLTAAKAALSGESPGKD